MIQPALVAALAAVIGGAIAVGARDSRFVALGLGIAMVAAPLASSPEPTALAIAFRVVGALLAAYLLVASARAQSILGDGSGIGATAELATAAVAFCVGWFVVPVQPLAGPVAAQAAGVSLAGLAVAPLFGRDVLRAGAGAAILALGISMLFEAWVGPASALQQIVLTALLVGIVGATSLLISPSPSPATRRRSAAGVSGEASLLEASEELAAEVAGSRPDDAAAVTGAGAVRVPNAQAPASRSRRASRGAAPSWPPDQAAPLEEPAPARPKPTVAATPASTRARWLHPREPRR